MITEYVTASPEAEAAVTAPEPKHVWIHGSTTYVYTGEDIPSLPSED